MLHKIVPYRISPTKKQERQLDAMLEECRWLYNHLLEKRRDAYEHTGTGLSCSEQQATYGILKQEHSSLDSVHSQVLQQVAVRIDLAMKAFFRRGKADEKPGYPRFAEEAGRQLIKVNPAYTSQTCSRCGHRQKMPLSERTYHCPCCLLVIDRDVNAALNILALGLQCRVVPEALRLSTRE